ncbi:MAG: hypothetical protein MUO88_10170, partial [Desulfobacterales bacterium]|nr:hypothetical protein [Desulfobacterales bacterium]
DVNSLITVKKVGDDKYVSEEDYWVIRSQALTELIPFLTHTRTEAKGHYKALTDYIKHIGKGQDFLDSGIKGSSSPAEYAKLIGKAEEFEKNNIELPEKYMTWDQLVELAMEFVMNEGYVPTDVNGPEEIEMFKQICEQKEKYGKKVQTDLRKIAQDCMDMKAYLDSINEFEACVKYTRYQKEQKQKARAEEMEGRREDRAAVERSKRETELEERQDLKDARRKTAAADRRLIERQRRLGHTYYRGRYRRIPN